MKSMCDANLRRRDSQQRGGSRLNFLIFMALLVAAIYGGYQALPIVYQASTLKVYMQDTVNAAAATNRTPEWARQQIIASRDEYGIPLDAAINVVKKDQRLELRVQFTRAVALPGYVYNYNFDHTAKSRNLF
ncbi:MAG: hypothetical protein ACR2GW_02845 [Pyrinomonadaceae bacterium]|nr:hypothetical protein [Acidobacteriota bacterium]